MTAAKTERMVWRIVLRSRHAQRRDHAPSGIATIAPRLRDRNMPYELAALLPANSGPSDLIADAVTDPGSFQDLALGLFISHPFLNIERERERLLGSGCRWIANLPSVAQQDEEFSRQLTDVALDQSREFDALKRFRQAGFGIAAVISDAAGAEAAVEVAPDIVIVLPRIGDYAAGFPSLRQRGSAVTTVHDVLRVGQWTGILLCLAEDSEAEHETLWPGCVDGVLCRPSLR